MAETKETKGNGYCSIGENLWAKVDEKGWLHTKSDATKRLGKTNSLDSDRIALTGPLVPVPGLKPSIRLGFNLFDRDASPATREEMNAYIAREAKKEIAKAKKSRVAAAVAKAVGQ